MKHPYADFLNGSRSRRATRRRVPGGAQGPGGGRGARVPRVPRRLRHRDVPPRDQDPLLAAQQGPADRLRARVRAVGRHGGRAARARAAAGVARERARRCAIRRGRLLAAVRADVHERAHAARSRRHPAARGRSRRGRAARASRGGPTATHPEPLAPFIDAVLHRRGRGGAAARSCSRGARAASRAGRAAARAAGPAGRARSRSTCRRSTRPSVDAETGLDRRRRAARSARAARASTRAGSPTSTASRSPTTRRCRTPRRSSIACRSRSRAAAPRAAASARPA